MLWDFFAVAPGTSCAMCAWQYISAVRLFRGGPGHHLHDSSAVVQRAVGLVCGGPGHQLRSVRAAAESAVRWLKLEIVNGKARCVYTAVPTVAASANGASRASATKRRSHMSNDGRVSRKSPTCEQVSDLLVAQQQPTEGKIVYFVTRPTLSRILVHFHHV